MNIGTQDSVISGDPKSVILQHLQQGRWVAPYILPNFRDSLGKKLDSLNIFYDCKSTSVMAMAARIYRNLQFTAEHNPNSQYEPKLKLLNNSDYLRDKSTWDIAIAVHEREAQFTRIDDEWNEALSVAISTIRDNSAATFSTLETTVNYICPIHTSRFKSASHPHFFGCLFLARETDPKVLAISIVHELAHQELFLLNLIDRLVVENSDYSLIHSPYQDRVRPPIGRLHSAHALYRMKSLEEIIDPDSARRHAEMLQKTAKAFAQNEVTPFGWGLVNDVY